MRTMPYLYAICILCSCSSKLSKTEYPKTANPGYSSQIEGRIERVVHNLQARTSTDSVFEKKTLSEQMKKYGIPGVSIAVINEGRIEWARGFGITDSLTMTPVTTTTLFQAASISKPVFALAVMQLKAKGRLDLDKDVNEYLVSWKVPMSAGGPQKVTLRQLLSHTAGMTVSGFDGYKKTASLPTVAQVLSGLPPANSPAVMVDTIPGTRFRYSGGGFTVAQLAVVEHLKKPLPLVVKEEIFKPLNLRYSTYEQPLPPSLESLAATGYQKGKAIEGKYHVYPEMAAAGLWTNPSELATIVLEIQKGVKGASSLFTKETIEEMFLPQAATKAIGIGFFQERKGSSLRFNHNGWNEGFVSYFRAFKDLGKGVVIMTNADEGLSLINQILNAVAIQYEWADYQLR